MVHQAQKEDFNYVQWYSIAHIPELLNYSPELYSSTLDILARLPGYILILILASSLLPPPLPAFSLTEAHRPRSIRLRRISVI